MKQRTASAGASILPTILHVIYSILTTTLHVI